jgi:hypothetical protein
VAGSTPCEAASRQHCRSLKRVDPGSASYYDQRKADFDKRIDNAMFGEELVKLVGIQKLTRLVQTGELQNFLATTSLEGSPLGKTGGWLKQAESLNGVKVLEFHKVWAYFARAFGMKIVGTIEERPGIPPGPQHVRQITDQIKADKIPLISWTTSMIPLCPITFRGRRVQRSLSFPIR